MSVVAICEQVNKAAKTLVREEVCERVAQSGLRVRWCLAGLLSAPGLRIPTQQTVPRTRWMPFFAT